MTRYRVIGYHIDAIHDEVVAQLAAWGDLANCTVKHVPGTMLSIYHPGLFAHEYDTLDVFKDGLCAIHWSIPRGIGLQSIVERHRIVEELPDA